MLGQVLLIIACNVLVGYICMTITLFREYRKQEREIAEYKATIKELQNEIKALNKRNEALMWACGHKAAKERQTKQEN